VWGALLGFLIFAEVPDLFTWVGGVMIFSSTTYLALRESRTAWPAPARAADPGLSPEAPGR
jgi:drug/metabolite transporter (DMT)-like permease